MRLYLQALGLTAMGSTAMVGIVLLVAYVTGAMGEQAIPKAIAHRFGGPENVAVLIDPSRVEAFAIRHPPEVHIMRDVDPLTGYVTVVGPVDVPRRTARELSEVLLDAKSFTDWNVATPFKPQLRIRFFRDLDSLDLVIDLSLSLMIYDGTNRFGSTDFSSEGRKRLKSIAKRIFPDEPSLTKPGWIWHDTGRSHSTSSAANNE